MHLITVLSPNLYFDIVVWRLKIDPLSSSSSSPPSLPLSLLGHGLSLVVRSLMGTALHP